MKKPNKTNGISNNRGAYRERNRANQITQKPVQSGAADWPFLCKLQNDAPYQPITQLKEERKLEHVHLMNGIQSEYDSITEWCQDQHQQFNTFAQLMDCLTDKLLIFCVSLTLPEFNVVCVPMQTGGLFLLNVSMKGFY